MLCGKLSALGQISKRFPFTFASSSSSYFFFGSSFGALFFNVYHIVPFLNYYPMREVELSIIRVYITNTHAHTKCAHCMAHKKHKMKCNTRKRIRLTLAALRLLQCVERKTKMSYRIFEKRRKNTGAHTEREREMQKKERTRLNCETMLKRPLLFQMIADQSKSFQNQSISTHALFDLLYFISLLLFGWWLLLLLLLFRYIISTLFAS